MEYTFNTALYLNIPYKFEGRDLNGCDCWGLIKLIYKEQWGIELPEYFGQYTTVQKAKDSLVSKGVWEEVFDNDSPSIVLMSLYNTDEIDHVAYNIDRYRFFHTTKEFGKPFVTKRSNVKYRFKLRGSYKYVI